MDEIGLGALHLVEIREEGVGTGWGVPDGPALRQRQIDARVLDELAAGGHGVVRRDGVHRQPGEHASRRRIGGIQLEVDRVPAGRQSNGLDDGDILLRGLRHPSDDGGGKHRHSAKRGLPRNACVQRRIHG